MTSVGATEGVGTETAASFSSGGFSNIFSIPSYQSDAVSAYLSELGDTNAGLFNGSGRGFPDIAFNGNNFPIILNDFEVLAFGTSCAAPSIASIISLINSELLSQGKPVLGFLNPFLYSTGASAFTDILSGTNPGCNTTGFPAETGWDPVCHLLVCLISLNERNSCIFVRLPDLAHPCIPSFLLLQELRSYSLFGSEDATSHDITWVD